VTKDYSASVLSPSADLSLAELERRVRPLVAEARRTLTSEGFRGRTQEIQRLLDVRYAGQSYEITVPLTRDYRALFDRAHARLYGYANPSRPTEVVNVRVTARGETAKPALPFERVTRRSRPRPVSRRRGHFSGRAVNVAFYRWPELRPGAAARGPAVITGGEATVVVPPGSGFEIDGFGNVIVSVPGARSRR
jgi:N-methylhydantoinase A/oxoprolinase/acetone carboxylase beta subunit